MAWSRKLTKVLETNDGKTLRTLLDAGAYASDLSVQYSTRPQWQHAIELMLAAAEGNGSVRVATEQIEKALFLDMRLKLPPAPPRKSKNKVLS